jgi:heme-degrading monooxygenase HmoA
MYARVARFEGRDASLTDDLIRRAREVGPTTIAEAKGFLGFFDREGGTALSVTFFDSEEAIRSSEQAFEDMAQHFPEEMRGRRTSVDVYEVTIFDADAERAKAARVNTFEGSPEGFDDAARSVREETLPQIRQTPGNVGLIALGDRNSGRVLGITLWESEDAMRSSEEQANRLREQSAESTGQRIVSVDRYEVAVAHELSGVRA